MVWFSPGDLEILGSISLVRLPVCLLFPFIVSFLGYIPLLYTEKGRKSTFWGEKRKRNSFTREQVVLPYVHPKFRNLLKSLPIRFKSDKFIRGLNVQNYYYYYYFLFTVFEPEIRTKSIELADSTTWVTKLFGLSHCGLRF